MENILKVGFFAIAIISIAYTTGQLFGERPIENTKTFKVECKSFGFDGEVFRDGKKFYELSSGKEIWIPLGDCLLREVE